MHSSGGWREREIYCWAALTMALALLISVTCLNPLWERMKPPFEMPRVLPAISAPVDGPFYLRNAQVGYAWHTRDPLSLWFHPLLSALLHPLPRFFPVQYWFLGVCVTAGSLSLVLVYRLANVLMPEEHVRLQALPFILGAPAGLSVATGSPELVSLFFHAALLLSVLTRKHPAIVLCCAVAAILVKPNALYMVPTLVVYLFGPSRPNGRQIKSLACIGIGGILLTWLGWILFVGWKTGDMHAYWSARQIAGQYVGGTPEGFFDALARSFLDQGSFRDRIRYGTALTIPVVNIWLAGTVSFECEHDRFAVAVGNSAMLGIALISGNPNKIIMYALTIPGNLAMHLAIANKFLAGFRRMDRKRLMLLVAYGAYCSAMLFVFVWGTPLGWYY